MDLQQCSLFPRVLILLSYEHTHLCYYRLQKNPDDVVITLAIRTPLTKGFKGGMKDTSLDFMIYTLLKQVLEKSNIDPQMVEDVCLGNVRLRDSSLHAVAD